MGPRKKHHHCKERVYILPLVRLWFESCPSAQFVTIQLDVTCFEIKYYVILIKEKDIKSKQFVRRDWNPLPIDTNLIKISCDKRIKRPDGCVSEYRILKYEQSSVDCNNINNIKLQSWVVFGVFFFLLWLHLPENVILQYMWLVIVPYCFLSERVFFCDVGLYKLNILDFPDDIALNCTVRHI